MSTSCYVGIYLVNPRVASRHEYTPYLAWACTQRCVCACRCAWVRPDRGTLRTSPTCLPTAPASHHSAWQQRLRHTTVHDNNAHVLHRMDKNGALCSVEVHCDGGNANKPVSCTRTVLHTEKSCTRKVLTWAVQMLLVALSRRMCCSRVCNASR